VYELLISGMARSEILAVKVAALVESNFESGGALRIFSDKDLPLVLEAGRDLKVPLITASAAFQLMQLAHGSGPEGPTDADLIRLLTERAAVDDPGSVG
jgi:3-hydroxyisobutyrate dehydrogenase-like beta-hydroxyacid dehydrogenase